MWPVGWGCSCSRTCSTPSTWRRRAVTSGPALAEPAESVPTAKLPFDVMAGLPAPSEWQRFSPATADVLLAALSERAGGHTVVTTSPIVEDLRRWVDRYGLSRHLLATRRHRGRRVRGDTARVLRFVDWLAECQPRRPVVTVVNKVPASRFSAAEVVEQLRSLCGDRIEVAATVPFDRRVVAAEWDATLPARGPFTKRWRGDRSSAGAGRAGLDGGGPPMRTDVGCAVR